MWRIRLCFPKTKNEMFGKLTQAFKNLDTDAIVEKAAPMLNKALGREENSASEGPSQPPTRAPLAREESFAHLNATGKRKALLIGINYTGLSLCAPCISNFNYTGLSLCAPSITNLHRTKRNPQGMSCRCGKHEEIS